MKKIKIFFIATTILLLFSLSACVDNSNPQIEPTSSESTPIVVETKTTTEPTVSVTQETPPKFFILTQNSDIFFPSFSSVEQLSTTISNLGYEVTINDNLPDTQEFYRFILLFSPSQETISQFQPQTVDNLLIVDENKDFNSQVPVTLFDISPADRIFIAGYLSAIISNDWRVGGLFPSEMINNTSMDQIFQNGVKFFCGRCLPVFGPIVNFPITASVATPEDENGTIQAFGTLSTNKVNTVFIPSPFLFEDLVILLQQTKTTIISDSMFDSDRSDWVDYAIIDNLSTLIIERIQNDLNQESVVVVPVDYSIMTSGEGLSTGKNNFISKLMNDLKNNFVSPYSINMNE